VACLLAVQPEIQRSAGTEVRSTYQVSMDGLEGLDGWK
jgi:hypothetical protein